MNPKTEAYIQEFIRAKFPQDPPRLGELQKFLRDPGCANAIVKIMNQAHKDILYEWSQYKGKGVAKAVFPVLDDSLPIPPRPASVTTLPKAAAPITKGSPAMVDSTNPVANQPVPYQQNTAPTPPVAPIAAQPTPAPALPTQPTPPLMPPSHGQAPHASPPPRPSAVTPPVTAAPASPSPSAPKTATPMNASFRMQNAKVGVPYENAIEITSQNANDIAIAKVDGLADVGLKFDSAAMKVVGTPTKSGDFGVVVWFSKLGDSSQIPVKCNLTINPDPKSLWLNTPSDQSGLYAKPDEDKWLITGPEHVLVAASKRGRSHAHTGIYRDDDFFIGHVKETGWDVAVVSDGAGSCKYSRRGAELICKEGGERLHLLLSGDDGKKLTDAVTGYKAALDAGQMKEQAETAIRNALWTTVGYAAHHATKRLQEEMTSRADLNAVMKDYSATALFGIAKKFPFGTLCAAFWVGDGAVAVMREDGTHTLLGEADGGEYSGQTRFLGPEYVKPDELAKRLRFELVPDFKALVLMSDGVSDPYFETDAGLANSGKWKALWDELEGSVELSKRGDKLDERMLTWLDFWSAGNHDDRTLAVIY